MITRRGFTASLGAAACSLAVGGRARAFGEVPAGQKNVLLPQDQRAESVLEIFLYGGVSQYESFYCIPGHGAANGTHYNLFLATGDVEQAVANCGYSGPLTEPFAEDALGQTVHLGPYVQPLRNRSDLVDRMRVVLTRHDLEPHEAAIPFGLTGRTIGNPRLAGLGAHIQRHFGELDGSSVPRSFVLSSLAGTETPTDNLGAALAIGKHPGSARPLSLRVDASAELDGLLSRQSVKGHRDAYDELIRADIERFRARLTRPNADSIVRSPAFADLSVATEQVAQSSQLRALLEPQYFDLASTGYCGSFGTEATAANLDLARHLLTTPTTTTRYVLVVDAGLYTADGGGAYDTHAEAPYTQATNLGFVLSSLVRHINAPGENDPDKIDLDRTMIIINTEFGRSPTLEGALGRNHWPYGYPTVLLGGPTKPRSVFGAVQEDPATAVSWMTPTEIRVGALLSMGIWPFEPEAFNVADVREAETEDEAALIVQRDMLGVDG